MTLEGDFVAPPTAPIAGRVVAIAAIVALLTCTVALAVFLLYLALALIPVVAGAGLIAYGTLRWQFWRARRALLGRKRDLFRA